MWPIFLIISFCFVFYSTQSASPSSSVSNIHIPYTFISTHFPTLSPPTPILKWAVYSDTGCNFFIGEYVAYQENMTVCQEFPGNSINIIYTTQSPPNPGGVVHTSSKSSYMLHP